MVVFFNVYLMYMGSFFDCFVKPYKPSKITFFFDQAPNLVPWQVSIAALQDSTGTY